MQNKQMNNNDRGSPLPDTSYEMKMDGWIDGWMDFVILIA
jgi:hypothetical protein